MLKLLVSLVVIHLSLNLVLSIVRDHNRRGQQRRDSPDHDDPERVQYIMYDVYHALERRKAAKDGHGHS